MISFSEEHVLNELKHYLPSQTPLKDFIHHNTLHAFQKSKFYDAIFKGSKIFGFKPTLQLNEYRKLFKNGRITPEILSRTIIDAKGLSNLEVWKSYLIEKKYDEHVESRIGKLRAFWKTAYKLDIDNLVHPILFRIISSYLDQGVAISDFPIQNKSFLESIKDLELNGFVSVFKTERAKKILFSESLTLKSLLVLIVGDEAYFEQYLFDQQFSHKGWSGMVSVIEEKPESLLSQKKITLSDFIILELLLELDNLDYELGSKWQPLSANYKNKPINLFDPIEKTEINEVLEIWQTAFEWSYYNEVFAGIEKLNQSKQPVAEKTERSFQALFCIDERECSFRRHLENVDVFAETFGTPGFFGVEFYFQAHGAQFYDKLCPAPVTPKYLIKEYDVSDDRKHEILYSKKNYQVSTGLLGSLSLGFWSGLRLVQNIFSPKMSPAISNAFSQMHIQGKLTVEFNGGTENDLNIGFTVEEMANRVSSLLQGIALTSNFSKLVYIVAHGSSSANNPHHGAHDCGACSGRPGSVNARVFAIMANHTEVRKVLKSRGIVIPDETEFVAALHDTAADEMVYYDLHLLSVNNKLSHLKNVLAFENALYLNAKERSRRFASINTKQSIKKTRLAIKKRSVSLFEPRPELGHGTNTLCIVGNRTLTKGLFLDRRAFLNSYDYRTDLNGEMLAGIMKPLGPVCGGINLEYYFSRVDNYKLGAGTKLPHNVNGLIGVTNSCDGDLRSGLPWQMIEVHDPVRLMIVVEHYPNIVLKTIASDTSMYEWFINEWVHLSVINPDTKEFFYFKNGKFEPYNTLTENIEYYSNIHVLLEGANEMETNHIVHATQENLPIYLYN